MILPGHPRVRLASVASSFPGFRVDRNDSTWGLQRLFSNEDPEFVEQLVERSGVESRYLAASEADLFTPPDFTARNDRYREQAVELAREACANALARAGRTAPEVDVIIDVSCTGISIPALDVALSSQLGLRADVRRVPITESGCAGGALGLGLAAQLAHSGQTVLLTAVELASLTFLEGDRSRTNLIAAVLFGDGAAAAVIAPDDAEHAPAGPSILAVGSHLFPDSAQAMGFDVGTHGLRIVLQRELPAILRRNLRAAVLDFLERHGRAEDDLGLHLVHPGGRRILDTYEGLFALAPEDLRCSRESLRRYGNLSSASILTVLELALQDGVQPADGREALLVAFGPGLSAELALLEWDAA